MMEVPTTEYGTKKQTTENEITMTGTTTVDTTTPKTIGITPSTIVGYDCLTPDGGKTTLTTGYIALCGNTNRLSWTSS
jgi:hypothetical protein